MRSAFETTQISVQSPTSSMDSIGVFLFLSRRSSANSGHPKVIFSYIAASRSTKIFSSSGIRFHPSVPFIQWGTGRKCPSWVSI